MKKYISKGPDETKEIGFNLGRLLAPGDIVGLYGELGAGKTVMAKGIARAFGIAERDVVSASFTIVSEYPTDPPFIHIDLYRVDRQSELAELGLSEQVGDGRIAVIEWAEKADDEIPADTIKVRFRTVDNSTREIEIEGADEKDWNNL